jgi:large subunit ribosomal protein L21
MFSDVPTRVIQYLVHSVHTRVFSYLESIGPDNHQPVDNLLAGDGSDLKKTDGLKVSAEIIAQAKGEKVTVFKKRRRHNYRRKKGHRQQHTILRIVAIGDHKAEKKAAPKPEKASAPAPSPAKSEAAPTAAAPKAEKPKAEKKAAPAKAAKPTEKPAAKASTKNAAPAKGAAKKPSKPKK